MKKLLYGIIFLLIASDTFASIQNLSESAKQPLPIYIAYVDKREAKRPRVSALSNVQCYYYNKALYISFINPEGEAELTISNDDNTKNNTVVFSTDQLFIYDLGECSGTVHIEIETSNGRTYSGVFDSQIE